MPEVGTSLVAPVVKNPPSIAWGMGLIPAQGTRILHAAQRSQEKIIKMKQKSKIKRSKWSTYLLKPTPLLHKPQDVSDLTSQGPEPP